MAHYHIETVIAGLRKNPKDETLLSHRRTLMKEISKYEAYRDSEKALEQGAP